MSGLDELKKLSAATPKPDDTGVWTAVVSQNVALLAAARNSLDALIAVAEAAGVLFTDTRAYPPTSNAHTMYFTLDAVNALRDALARLDGDHD